MKGIKMKENEVVFKQLAHIGVLAKNPSGWTKEVNIIGLMISVAVY